MFHWDLQSLFRASHDLGKSKGTVMAPGSLSWVTKNLPLSERQRQRSPGGEGATEQRWGLTRGGGEMPQVQSQVTDWLPGGMPTPVARGRWSESQHPDQTSFQEHWGTTNTSISPPPAGLKLDSGSEADKSVAGRPVAQGLPMFHSVEEAPGRLAHQSFQ